MRLSFPIPVPLNAGCVIDIQFPSEISISSTLSKVYGLSVFGSKWEFTGSIVNSSLYRITDACVNYTDTSKLEAIIDFENATNPRSIEPTSSF